MGKALIIAEKPSVAADIARALGGFTKQGDYFESDAFVLSSAVGHLVEIAAPEKYEVKRGKWSFANLPVIPPEFDLKPIEKSAPRRLSKHPLATAVGVGSDIARCNESKWPGRRRKQARCARKTFAAMYIVNASSKHGKKNKRDSNALQNENVCCKNEASI
jgi:hypothetical protein